MAGPFDPREPERSDLSERFERATNGEEIEADIRPKHTPAQLVAADKVNEQEKDPKTSAMDKAAADGRLTFNVAAEQPRRDPPGHDPGQYSDQRAQAAALALQQTADKKTATTEVTVDTNDRPAPRPTPPKGIGQAVDRQVALDKLKAEAKKAKSEQKGQATGTTRQPEQPRETTESKKDAVKREAKQLRADRMLDAIEARLSRQNTVDQDRGR